MDRRFFKPLTNTTGFLPAPFLVDGRWRAFCEPCIDASVFAFLDSLGQWDLELVRLAVLGRAVRSRHFGLSFLIRFEQIGRCPPLVLASASRTNTLLDRDHDAKARSQEDCVPANGIGTSFEVALLIDENAGEYPYCRLMAFYRCLDEGPESAALEPYSKTNRAGTHLA